MALVGVEELVLVAVVLVAMLAVGAVGRLRLRRGPTASMGPRGQARTPQPNKVNAP